MILHFPLSQVISPRKVTIVDEFDTVLTAIRAMDEGNISALPVKNALNVYVGVISKTDIASLRFIRLIQEKGSEKLYVKELMNRTPPIYVMESDTVADAVAIMHRHQIHRVFVSDVHHKICGIISTSDVIKLLVVEKYL